ncbi:glycoside hydrolase family 71/99 protein [Occallatibacter riparius]|uniref:Uncharacterized protein n=1 Tax=Occallatibacter riparius TaxID=1002689 RepID=A0A9J7BNM2_9BACT|nr:hypothetical protein [Occallatibacter riparius]UWZ84223.1 hypothetical protein MOP44_27205 [Occallatibacter riparius]
MKKACCVALVCLGLVLSLAAGAQVKLSELTGNNTSACAAGGKLPGYCKQAFAGQTDTRPGVATPVFDAPAGNVSDEDIHGYLNQGGKTKIFANFMLGFCTWGSGHWCHRNVRTGYNSNDDATVAAQVEDLRRRHIDGAIMSWEGYGTSEDEAALRFQRYANKHYCKGAQQCDPMYLIMIDGPSWAYSVKSTGIPGTSGAGCGGKNGGAYEDCVIAHVRNDMCSMNGTHWGNDAYLKENGRPVVMVFPEEGVIRPWGPAPSWEDVWVHIAEWNRDLPHNCGKAPYNQNNGVPLVVFEHGGGFMHRASDGAYYWVQVAGTDPAKSQYVFNVSSPSTVETLEQFYQSAQKNAGKMVWGAAFKGFNSAQAAWGTNRILDQACGQVWMQSLTEGNRFYRDEALPFLQVITWNDYNEGTEIETGIDNCFTVSAEVKGTVLEWKLNASNEFASLSTVSHVEIYDSNDGENLRLIDKVPAERSGTWDLGVLPAGTHRVFVRMVGKNSILNRMSGPAVFTK